HQVILEHAFDQLTHALAVLASGHQLDLLFYGGQSVSHRAGKLAHLQESVIVLCVADAGHVMRGQSELTQSEVEAGGLIDPAGQDHYSLAVKDDLQLEAHLADQIQDDYLVRYRGSYDDAAL